MKTVFSSKSKKLISFAHEFSLASNLKEVDQRCFLESYFEKILILKKPVEILENRARLERILNAYDKNVSPNENNEEDEHIPVKNNLLEYFKQSYKKRRRRNVVVLSNEVRKNMEDMFIKIVTENRIQLIEPEHLMIAFFEGGDLLGSEMTSNLIEFLNEKLIKE